MPTDKNYWRSDRVVYRRKPQKNRALLNKNRLIILGVLAALCLVYWGIYVFLHLEYFRVTEIAVSGTEAIPADDIKNYLAGEIAGARWNILPKDNILFYSTDKAGEKLEDKFPAIKTAVVEKHMPGGISASISERKLEAIYCKSASDNATSTSGRLLVGQCFFMDGEGIIFSSAPKVEGTLILAIISDDPAGVSLGRQVMEPEELLNLEKLATTFSEFARIAVNSFELRKNAPEDVWAISSAGYFIIVSRADDYEKVAGIVKTVIDSEVKGRISQLDYIDARFGNKVFVKYK